MNISLDTLNLKKVRTRKQRTFGYNIEMTELTGGTFWKPYTHAQVVGEEEFPELKPTTDLAKFVSEMMTVLPPVDLSDVRLRTLARGLGPAIVRYSGGWATKTYFDHDGTANGKAPAGFDSVLTSAQWDAALDFAKYVDAEILISVANCPGVHKNGTGEWLPSQAEALWNYTAAKGMHIAYAEFMNEPNMLVGANMPADYGVEEYGRDHDLFAKWLAENHPETTLIGPCSAYSPRLKGQSLKMMLPGDKLLQSITVMPKGLSYHSYTGISERGKLFGNHYEFDEALSEAYLNATMQDLDYYKGLRDKYMPNADFWVTESADAGSGGNTWAPTFIETIRFVDELAKYALNADVTVLHNTLCSSAYGLLEAETNIPRPQYWGGVLYNKLMGKAVYDTGVPISEGVHLYAQSRADGQDGVCYLYVNNSRTESATLQIPCSDVYMLTSSALRSTEIYLNGSQITMPSPDAMPALAPRHAEVGTLEIPPCSVTFIVTAHRA